MGIRILPEAGDPARALRARSRPDDVVILPAFGVPVAEMEHLRAKGCVLVDTTCGSVLNVWKNVHKYAREGFTAVIHGKHYHEETKATASQALTHAGGHYLCVRDRAEAEVVCGFIRGQVGAAEVLRARFAHATSPGFDPERDLAAHRPRQPDDDADEREPGDPGDAARGDARPLRRGGAAASASAPSTRSAPPPRTARTRSCKHARRGRLDVMVVIGGYNSSNTQALARICAERLPTYHISGPERLEGHGIRHRPVGAHDEVRAASLAARGPGDGRPHRRRLHPQQRGG